MFDVLKFIRRNLKAFSQLELVQIVHYISLLGLKRDHSMFSRDWVDTIDLDQCSSRHLALVLMAFQRMKQGVRQLQSDQFFRKWAAQTQGKLGELSAKNLVQIIGAVARLELGSDILGAAWYQHWGLTTQNQFREMSGQELGNTVYALSLLKDAVSSVCDALGEQFFKALANECLTYRFLVKHGRNSLSAQNFASLMYGLGCLGQGTAVMGEEWFQEWCKQSEMRLDDFNPQDLSWAIRGLGSLGVGPAVVGVQWFQHWADCSSPRLGEFHRVGLCHSIHALSLLNVGPENIGKGWFEAFGREFYHTSPVGLRLSEYINLVRSMAALKLDPKLFGSDFFHRWAMPDRRGLVSFLAAASPSALVIVVQSLSTLSLSMHHQLGDEFTRQWLFYAMLRFNLFSAQEVATAFPHVSQLEVGDLSEDWDAFEAWLDLVAGKLEEMTPNQLYSVFLGLEARVTMSDAVDSLWTRWIECICPVLPLLSSKQLARVLVTFPSLNPSDERLISFI